MGLWTFWITQEGCPVLSRGGREHFDTDSRGEACVCEERGRDCGAVVTSQGHRDSQLEAGKTSLELLEVQGPGRHLVFWTDQLIPCSCF